MHRKLRRLLLVLGLAAVALTVIVLLTSGPPPPVALPTPNGYDDFLRAASLVSGDVGNASRLDHDGLRDLIATNSEPLRLLRLGLTRQCAAPTDTIIANFPGKAPTELNAMKRLVQLTAAEGRLWEMDGRFAEAAQSYVDAIQFGNEMSRGGVVIYRLVGIVCETIGANALGNLLPKLKKAESHRIVSRLEKIDSARVTWDEVRRSEKRFAHHQLRKVYNPITQVTGRWQVWRMTKQIETRHNQMVAHERLLAAELALRCYEDEQGHPPTSLEQLAPNYLESVPLDPFSNKPMIYRAQATHWLLYSVGPDGVDDGGKPLGRSRSGAVAKGDLFYDSSD